MAQTKTDRSLDVKPLDVDGVKTFKLGTATFIVALILCLIFHQQLAEHGQQWWIWTCVTGIVIGIIGSGYTSRRAKVYAEDRASREAETKDKAGENQ